LFFAVILSEAHSRRTTAVVFAVAVAFLVVIPQGSAFAFAFAFALALAFLAVIPSAASNRFSRARSSHRLKSL
jgi:drug/metabolite transporter (DMT)-like permease